MLIKQGSDRINTFYRAMVSQTDDFNSSLQGRNQQLLVIVRFRQPLLLATVLDITRWINLQRTFKKASFFITLLLFSHVATPYLVVALSAFYPSAALASCLF